jgi:hypothetical protein
VIECQDKLRKNCVTAVTPQLSYYAVAVIESREAAIGFGSVVLETRLVGFRRGIAMPERALVAEPIHHVVWATPLRLFRRVGGILQNVAELARKLAICMQKAPYRLQYNVTSERETELRWTFTLLNRLHPKLGLAIGYAVGQEARSARKTVEYEVTGQDGLPSTRARSRLLRSQPLTIAEIPPERRAIKKVATLSGFVARNALL